MPEKSGKTHARKDGLDSQDKILIFAAGLTAIVGLCLVIIGMVLRFGRGFKEFVTYAKAVDDFLELGRLDIVFGLYTACAILLIVVFFAAIIGVLRGNSFILKTYAAFLGLLVIVQLVVGLLAFTYADDINNLSNNDVLNESLWKAMVEVSNTPPYVPAKLDDNFNFWMHTQHTFKCCGLQGNQDWMLFPNDTEKLKALSCTQSHYNAGCQKKIRDRVKQDVSYFGVTALAILVVELIAAFLSFYRTYTYDEKA